MTYFLMFLLGVILGVGIAVGYSTYKFLELKKLRESLMTQLKSKMEEVGKTSKIDSITERLVKASELAQAQLAIKAQLEAPSKNALHSRYKNGLVGEIQHMEQQKLDILKTILAEGVDPMITAVDETGEKSEILLSAYVQTASESLNGFIGNSAPPTDPMLPRKAGKFVVHKGGKDDSGTTH